MLNSLMANPGPSAMIFARETFEQTSLPMVNPSLSLAQLPLHHSNNSCHGPVAIFWDIENCPLPNGVHPEEVAGNIRMALRVHPVIKGAVTIFSACGDFNAFPRRLREGCQRTGVKLIDVPNGRKDAADKAILIDMFLFALDNPPPSSVMLISGDVDFSPALHVLGQRGYTVILVIPSAVRVSSALCNAGNFVWDWPSVARAEGFLPPVKDLSTYCNPSDLSTVLVGCNINDNVDGQNEEEAIVYRGVSQKFSNARDSPMVSHTLSGFTGSLASMPVYLPSSGTHSFPSCLNEVSDGPSDFMWVRPGDLNGLKNQMVKLLGLFGGRLPFARVTSEYQKLYGKPLFVSEYGSLKFMDLLKKMNDSISIVGKGQKRFVTLGNSRNGQNPLLLLENKEKKGKGSPQDPFAGMAGAVSSDELSDEEKVIAEENERVEDNFDLSVTAQSECLEKFKYDLQEILVTYSCRLLLDCFEAIYQQRYKRPLDYKSFGVSTLEDLLQKVKDIVVLEEEPLCKRKFLVAVGG